MPTKKGMGGRFPATIKTVFYAQEVQKDIDTHTICVIIE